LKNQAEQWLRWERSLGSHRRLLEHAEQLLTNTDATAAAWNRLGELRDVLPHLKIVVDQRSRLAAVELTIAELARERQELTRQIAEHDSWLAVSLECRHRIAAEIGAHEQQLQDLGLRLRELSESLGRSRVCGQLQEEFTELKQKLANLPSDVAEKLERTQRHYDDVLAITQIISPLTRLHRERESLRQVSETGNQVAEMERPLAEQLSELVTGCAELDQLSEAAAMARREADRQATEIRTLFEQAARRLSEFGEIEGQPACCRCGQTLTTEHVAAERARLESHLTGLDTRQKSVNEALTKAEQEEQRVLADRSAAEKRCAIASERLKELRQNLENLRADQLKHVQACQSIFDSELNAALRDRVATQPNVDWQSTTYPTQTDLDEMGQKLTELDAARQSLRLARSKFETFERLKDRAEFVGKSVAAQQSDVSMDPSVVRGQHEAAAREESLVKQKLDACRRQLEQENQTADRLMSRQNDLQRRLAAVQAEWKGAQTRLSETQEHLARCRAELRSDWQTTAETVTATVLRDLQREMTELIEQKVETRYRDAVQAEANVGSLRETVASLEARRNELPAEACTPIAEVERMLAVAKMEERQCDQALQEARLDADRLAHQQDQRERLRDQYLQASKQQRIHEILAALLGPRNLQRELVRQAEGEIVDLANTMLDRISGGQIELILARRHELENDALDRNVLLLEARNRSTASEPLGVAFLSGSQRFRVAVSLALGMGQYASARRRSIQSVIIDEGFGSLDREGRQVMIQELQNLAGHLECIVLVSHQEEFADAFPDGYRFELKDGATQVTRFHR
jgi:DNA repair exonuclease SbcCD ATPase subunit